ncbi:MAG: hypothetical protein HUJ30_00790 [Gammaproteobacteria bacterium]|nr:hypothetical protein [Gammaproteobacteria bacterium]
MPVLTCGELGLRPLRDLLSRYSLSLDMVDVGQPITGSWFGEPEAGIVGTEIIVRADTPVHSALHESCHVICMDKQRRAKLHTDAGGDYDEENGVCYLQILLGDYLSGFSRQRMMQDMDEWGYTFRLGSAQNWFEADAEDARAWLLQYQLIDDQNQPTWKLR